MSEAAFAQVAALAHQAASQPAQQPHADPVSADTKRLFMALHGAYGNAFLSKFSTGERDWNGKDKGVRSAMLVWQAKLLPYAADVLETAAARAMDAHPEFPPSLPQFEAICRAVAPRKTFAEEQGLPRLGAPKVPDVIGQYTAQNDGKDWARRILAAVDAGAVKPPTVVLFAKQGLGLAA